MKISPRYDSPTIVYIEGGPAEQLVPVTRQRLRMEAMLTGLTEDQWSMPSRCDGWTVRDVVAHLGGVNSFWSASIRAGLSGTPSRWLVGFDPADTPAEMVGALSDVASTTVFERFVASNDELLGLFAELSVEQWEMMSESPAGHVPIRLLAHHALWDSWVHERDIALPLGIAPGAEADEIRSVLQYAAVIGPALGLILGRTEVTGFLAIEATDPRLHLVIEVGDSVRLGDGCPPAGTPFLCGSAVELVEALSVRIPLPDAAPTLWRDAVAGIAAAFDVG